MKTQNKRLVLTAAVVIFTAALSRLLPHPPNFVPILALGVFGGTVIKDKKYAFIFPLAALLISDTMFQLFTSTPGFYGLGQVFVYAAFMLTTFVATRIRKVNVANVLLTCIASSVIFFLVSNFGDWIARSFYPKTFAGLMTCYADALPFYNHDYLFGSFALNTLTSTIFFTALMFGAYAVVKNALLQPAPQKA